MTTNKTSAQGCVIPFVKRETSPLWTPRKGVPEAWRMRVGTSVIPFAPRETRSSLVTGESGGAQMPVQAERLARRLAKLLRDFKLVPTDVGAVVRGRSRDPFGGKIEARMIFGPGGLVAVEAPEPGQWAALARIEDAGEVRIKRMVIDPDQSPAEIEKSFASVEAMLIQAGFMAARAS